MSKNRDRAKRKRGKPKVSDHDFASRLAQFCRLAHQQNTELLGLLRQQRQALLGVGRKELIQ